MTDKKNKVLEVATMLFAKNGFEKTSMATICTKAKVSKGLVYHHFKSKEAILLEIFSKTTEIMVEMNNNSTSELHPNTELQILITNIFSQMKEDKRLFQFNLNMMFQPATRKLLKGQIEKRTTILFNSIKRIFDKIAPARSEALSYLFIAEIDGIALNYLSVFDDYPLEMVKKELLDKYKKLKK